MPLHPVDGRPYTLDGRGAGARSLPLGRWRSTASTCDATTSQSEWTLAKIAWDVLDVMLTRFEFRAERPVEAPPLEAEPYRPSWTRTDEAVDKHTIADAAASVGGIYVSLGRLDDACHWIERAAGLYERLASLLDAPPPKAQSNFDRHVIEVARQVFVDHLRGQSKLQVSASLPDDLRMALQALPLAAQDLLELHYVYDLTIADLSAVFGVVEPAIHARMNRALQALSRELEAQGHDGMDEPTLRALLRGAANP